MSSDLNIWGYCVFIVMLAKVSHVNEIFKWKLEQVLLVNRGRDMCAPCAQKQHPKQLMTGLPDWAGLKILGYCQISCIIVNNRN